MRVCQPACGESLPGDERLLLMNIVPWYHGSTALEAVEMSSAQSATLCSAMTHECEAQ